MDNRFFYLLSQARHRVFRDADKRCREALGISVTQLGALLMVARHEGCLLKDLAATLNLNNSALTGLSDRMVQKGLVERRRCERDGRASRLYLTEVGRQKLDVARPQITELNERMVEGFNAEEVNVILRFLNRLVDEF